MTDPRVTEFLTRKHVDALPKIQEWTNISKRVDTTQTRKLAEAAVSAEVGTNFGWMSEQVRAALIECRPRVHTPLSCDAAR
jgi:hypothetical protein